MLNNVCLLGRLTAAPELKTTQSGVSVTTFTLAVQRNFKAPDGSYETDFIHCAAWRNTAEFVCKYFTKGQLMAAEGSLQTRSYTDKQGNKRTAAEVMIENVSFCGKQEKKLTVDFEEYQELTPF